MLCNGIRPIKELVQERGHIAFMIDSTLSRKDVDNRRQEILFDDEGIRVSLFFLPPYFSGGRGREFWTEKCLVTFCSSSLGLTRNV